MRPAAARALTVALLLGAASCGSDAPPVGGAEDDFLDVVDTACRSAENLIVKLAPSQDDAISHLADYLSAALDTLGTIDAPSAMTAGFTTFSSILEDQITELGKLARAIRNKNPDARDQAILAINDLRDSADEAAQNLGALKCVGITPADGLAPSLDDNPPPTTTTTTTTTTTPETTTTTVAATTPPTDAETTAPPATTAVPETTIPVTTVVTTTVPPTTDPNAPAVVSRVLASVTRPDSIDACGQPTTYPATNLIDGRRDSAWMAPGDASGERLTFTLAAPAVLTRVGLVPGYDKFDPCTDTDRFFELRRVTLVRWTFDDGTTIDQTLDANSPRMQYVSVPLGLTTSAVILEILETTAPGVERLDHTPISEVSIL